MDHKTQQWSEITLENSNIHDLIRSIAVVGNIVFILWILLNGINEEFSGTILEKVSYIGLLILLAQCDSYFSTPRKNLKSMSSSRIHRTGNTGRNQFSPDQHSLRVGLKIHIFWLSSFWLLHLPKTTK